MWDGIDTEDDILKKFWINEEWYSIAGSGGVGLYGSVFVVTTWWYGC